VGEVAVTGVQEPPPGRPAYGDAAVAAGVTLERHQQDVVAEHGDRLEAQPGLAADRVLDPARAVRPLGGEVAVLLRQCRPSGGGRELVGEDVHPRAGEVPETAGVVEVEMGEHDVGDVAHVVPGREHLGHRGLGGVQRRPGDADERPAHPLLGEVSGAEPGVDQRDALVPLDQQAVRDQSGRGEPAAHREARRHGRAVEVPDHGGHPQRIAAHP
jgi:hypothetical protein